jgi:hypothetical protein
MNLTPLDTHSSPEASQNPNQFAGGAQNKAIGAHNVDSGSMAKNLDTLYAQKDVPSPDEVACGIKYELSIMTSKDKAKAKEIVLNNLRKDPHFYGKLNQLNIDDKTMQVNETKKILKDLIKAREKKFAVVKGIGDIFDSMREGDRKFKAWISKK